MYTYVDDSSDPMFIEAMCVDGSMINKFMIEQWLQHAGYICFDSLANSGPGGYSIHVADELVADPGEWILYNPDYNALTKLSNAEFRETYCRAIPKEHKAAYTGE